MADVSTDFNPAFGGVMDRLRAQAAARGIQTHFISGVRSIDDQRQLYANYQAGKAGKPLPYPDRGPVSLAAKPGTSLHERGFAADLVADNPKQQAYLRQLGNQLGLRTLGTKDPNHFELSAAAIAKAPAYTPSGSSVMVASTAPIGTTINAATAPVAGALANQGPEGVGSSGPVAASEGPLDPRQLVYNKLVAAGLQPHQALGAVWSLAGESGRNLNPGAYNPKDPGGAVGLGQWIGPRRAALEAFAKARGTAITDPGTQADFLVDELTNEKAATYQPDVFSKMQGAKTAEDATRVWTGQFERPKVDNSAARIKGGANVASLDANGNFVLGSPAAPASSPAVASGTPAAATPPTDDRPWYSKAIGSLFQEKAGGKSPFDKMAEALSGGGQTASAQAPERSALSGGGPGARNVSPLLSNPQAYGQTLNSFSQPLTWNSGPARIPGVGVAGLQGGAVPAPGVSLTSVPAMPQGLGYGIDPVGYGYG